MAKKKNALLSVLAGAALAGGFIYLKNSAEKRKKAAEEDLETWEPEDDEDESWKASYTDENGEEMSSEEIKARVKEEASKAMTDFKEDAKLISQEIIAGLKKAAEDMKAAVQEAQKATAARKAEAFDEEDLTGEAAEAAEDTEINNEEK